MTENPPEQAQAGKMGKKEVQEYLDLYEALKTARQPWLALWEELARYNLPRKVPGMNSVMAFPNMDAETRLFDITAVQSAMILANGSLAWMTPQESPWFTAVPKNGNDDDGKLWLAGATEKMRYAMGASNFYNAIHECYLDRSVFGLSALYVEEGKKKSLNCQCVPVGTFVIDEDEEGTVDTFIRVIRWTARQCVKKFGYANVSEKVQKAHDGKGDKKQEKFEILHFIMPREERDKKSPMPKDMPIASLWIEKESKHCCREWGYPEMPVMVSRYLDWGTGTGGLYGWSPAWAALPEARQVNFMQMMMDALGEKMAFPPVLAPEGMENEIDPNAAGVTYVSADQYVTPPKEWMMGGRYDIGKDRIEQRQKAIKEAFHTDLFQMFANMEKQTAMTAREVAERSSEKLVQFSPTFARMTTELFNPLLARVFFILLRDGEFGPTEEIPRSLMIPVNEAKGIFDLPEPNIEYSSRIALAIRNLPTIGLWRTLELVQQVYGLYPGVVDNFDWDEAVRSAGLNDGMSAKSIIAMRKVLEIRKARAAKEEQMSQMMQAQAASESARNLGTIKPDSVVGQQLAQAA